MQVFKVPMMNMPNFYFCSIACAAMAGFPPQDGEFFMERDYAKETQCSNCNITINDSERARQVFEIVHANPRKTRNDRADAPKMAHNQHPQYEQWKSICPECRSIHTTHKSGCHEYAVELECTECHKVFTLKEGFQAELARQVA